MMKSGRNPETVRVKLLGGFRISVGSRTVGENGWRLRKARSLVKLLALTPGHRLHREQVMEWLWPDLDPKAASNNLHYALHVARRVLEPASATPSRRLRLSGSWLTLSPDGSVWTDVGAFEEATAMARRAREPSAYRAALELYAGDLLPEDRYEGWAEDRREEVRSLFLSLLTELAALHEERGELEPAIEAFRRTIAVEPTHEEKHAGLMRLYALSGRQADALGQYVQLRESLSRELGAKPSAASRRLHEEIAAGRFPPSPSPTRPTPEQAPLAEESLETCRHNLPTARSSFVGREREVLEVKRELTMTRLLTLCGAGGCGKTRLAVSVAKDLVSAYADGAWLVELASLSDPELVPQALAGALGVSEQPGRPLAATLAKHLRAKEMLLVLDNCEHLVEAVVGMADDLLSRCSRLRVLATSREALRIPGEVLWQVPSLSVPDPEDPTSVEELKRYEAVRLFLERARSRRQGFDLTEENAKAVAEICRRLDGIPLAVELAAARVGVLSAEQIAARLGNCLRLLQGGRTSELRHRTLRGTLDWSYSLLCPAEKGLFRRLSVFAGGWTLGPAEVVGTGNSLGKEEVLDLLSRLVDKSLVMTEVEAEGVLRYGMLEPVRQYGLERLEESGEAEAAWGRHALWCLALVEDAEPKVIGAEQDRWLEQLETEHDNLRVALRWFLGRGEAERGQRLAGALGDFWRVRGHLSEGLRWLEATLAVGEDTSPARVKALAHAGWMAWQWVDFERSTAFSEEALVLARKLGDKKGAAVALHNLGMVAIYHHMRVGEAHALFEESLALWRALGDKAGASRTLQRMGLVSVIRHDFEQATALYEESLMLAREVGDKVGITIALWLGALASLGRGEYERVRALCEEGLNLARQVGNAHAVAFILHVLAASVGAQGRATSSARLWGAAESLSDALGRAALGPAERHFYGSYIATARAKLDEKAWEAAWAKGRTMPLEESLEYALSEEQAPSKTLAPEKPLADRRASTLTRREREVALLVAQGLTNRQVGTELVLSEHTVAKHISKILKKLGLNSRAQIAAWIAE